MLPRISNALSQLVAPVASSRDGPVKREKPPEHREREPEFQRFQVIQGGAQGETPSEKPEETPAQNRLASGFTQLLNLFQTQRFTFARWLGVLAYGRALRGQKRFGKFEKGAMLDRKAE